VKLCIDARPLQNGHRVRGIGILLSNLLREMGQQLPEDEVTLITQQKAFFPSFFLHERRLETTRLERPNRFNWLVDQFFLPGLVKKSGAELFFATDINSYLLQQVGVRVVAMAYDLIPFLYPEVMASQPWPVRIGWRINFRKLASADAVIAISQATKNDLVRLFGLDPAKVKVIHPGIDHSLFNVHNAGESGHRAEVLNRYGITGQYFLYVGDSEWRKNLRRVLEALSGIHGDIGLVLVGKRARTDETLQRWIVELGLQGRVITPGYVPDCDLPPLYGQAQAFLFPSLYEGFGLPVAEAMACGCPVITSNVSSMPEVAGEAGLLVDPESVAEIRDAMEKVIAEPMVRNRMIADGLLRAQQFSWLRCAESTVSVLRSVAGDM
jgi:glycosyltransferase involved in cell wall biosynthesis